MHLTRKSPLKRSPFSYINNRTVDIALPVILILTFVSQEQKKITFGIRARIIHFTLSGFGKANDVRDRSVWFNFH